MKPPPFKYIAATSLDHALAMKAEYGDEARFLAGGQSLVPTLNFRLAQPAALIDINPLSALSAISRDGDMIRIGAMTRYRDMERDTLVREALPLIAEALPHIAHPQIRNRGTIGGNLSHADPASELPAITLALGGRMRAQSAKGSRWIEARDFFTGPLTTTLDADEMLVEIELPPARPRQGFSFMEVSRRRGDFAMMGIAASVSLDDGGAVASARMALCGAGDTPIDVSERAKPLVGQPVSPALLADIATSVSESINPSGNIHASPGYQRQLAATLVKRALATAAERAAHA